MSNPFLNGGPYLMGVVNVTPDSFSDGGKFLSAQQAIDHAKRLIDEGADIIDIGGESTRPGAAPVSVQEEMDRVLPVIEALKNGGKLISIDTRNAATMQAALNAGAGMINDVTALSGAESLKIAAHHKAMICLMHMQGTPQTMQHDPQYNNVVQEVFDYLQQRIETCLAAGIAKDRIIIDPGIGFGKNLSHNLELLRNADTFCELDVPVLLGLSRKRFIADILQQDVPAQDRLPGSLAAALYGLQQGVQILRVHDISATKQALAVFQALA